MREKSKTKVSKKSRILETVHEAARGLYKIGLIDKRKMEKFDRLYLKEIPNCSRLS